MSVCVCRGVWCVCVCINTAGYKKIIMCSRNIANNGAIIFHFLLYCWAGGAYPEVKELFQGCSPAAPGLEHIGDFPSYSYGHVVHRWNWASVRRCHDALYIWPISVCPLSACYWEKRSHVDEWWSEPRSEGVGDKCVCIHSPILESSDASGREEEIASLEEFTAQLVHPQEKRAEDLNRNPQFLKMSHSKGQKLVPRKMKHTGT